MTPTDTAPNGCATSKEQLLNRLARVEGQVRGVSRMVAQDRYCIEVLTQISAAQAAPERSLSSSVRRFVFE
ncbi:MAG: metal-sensitive transcriptional regulator, partial [Actinomycetota bacterium]|nr:metal-sensitive transcriptional regulator [Actinomycetota bacterium]